MSIQIDKPTVQDSGSVGVQEQSRSRPTSHNIGGPATHGFPYDAAIVTGRGKQLPIPSEKCLEEGISRRLLNWIGGNSNQLYSARLFRTKKSAIFCMCLYNSLYMKQCEKLIESKYIGTQEPIEYNGVTLSSNEVTIRVSENNEWKVIFERTKISRAEIEIQEVYQDNFKELLELNYPPRIVIDVKPMTPNSKPLELHVEGLNEDVVFILHPDYYVTEPYTIPPLLAFPHSSITTQVHEDDAELVEKERKKEGGVELSEMDRKAIFDVAMNLGHIDINIIKILVVGAGGVGKSCLLKFLCDLPAPDKYNSTGCIDTAQRVKCERILTNKDDSSEEIVWKLVGSEELKHFLVNAIKSRAATLTPKNEEIQLDVKSSQSSVPGSTEEETSLGEVTKEIVQLIGSTEEETSLGEFIKVVQLVGHKGGKLFSITWIYLVDSGGQPQFHELLTTFVRNATLGIFVVNLSEQLDDKPEIKYYKDGKPCGESYNFPLSHKEIFQHCVQTISSLYPTDHSLPSTASTQTEEPIAASKPKILVVGTHREYEGKSEESREEKEEKLNKILQPYTGVIKNDGKYIIFPIDSISRSPSDNNVLDKIRRGIVKNVKPFCKTKKLPLQYYALELELEVLAKKKGCDVISFEKCFNKFGPSLSFDKTKFLVAIQHLDELNLIMYFESHAPDVIFTNPNTLLDKVSEIIEKSYIWRNKVDSDESIELIEQGVVTLEVLKSFESSYVEGLFDHETLAKILTHLFVFVPISISKDKFFMPALLKVEEDLNSPTFDYFAVSFPSNAPMGLFSSSVVCLLSKYQWEKVRHLSRNSLTFKVDLARVTLLDKRSHFEVHIELDDKFKKILPKIKVKVCEDVINAIDEVKNVRKFCNLEYSECFRCPHSGTSPHLAKFEYSEYAGDFVLECTKNCLASPVEEWHKQWLCPSLEDVTTENEDVRKFSEDLYKYLQSKNVPKRDCDIIKEERISGLWFLDLSKEDWKGYKLSRAGIIAVTRLQERIRATQIEASTSPHVSVKPVSRVTTNSSVSTDGDSTAHNIDHTSLKSPPTESNTTPPTSTGLSGTRDAPSPDSDAPRPKHSPAADCAELVKQEQVQLEVAIVASGEGKLLASMMNSAGIMADGDHDRIRAANTQWTDRDKAGLIVKILRDKVNTNPKYLEKFMEILRSRSGFIDILDVFETTAGGKLK